MANAMDADGLIHELKKAEKQLGPISYKSFITEEPRALITPGPDLQGSAGIFDVELEGSSAKWWKHFSQAEMEPMRGARSIVWQLREDGILWYEVYDAGTSRPGIGTFWKEKIVNETPLVGRTYQGQWLSSLLGELKGLRVNPLGKTYVAQGEFLPGLTFVITFDSEKGWLATHGELRNAKDPTGGYQWTVTNAVKSDGSWYVAQAEATFRSTPDAIFPGLRRWTFTHSDLQTGKDAKLDRFPKPIAGTMVSGPESTNWILGADGKMTYHSTRVRAQRSIWSWNIIFVLSSSAILFVSVVWLVLSKRRSSSLV